MGGAAAFYAPRPLRCTPTCPSTTTGVHTPAWVGSPWMRFQEAAEDERPLDHSQPARGVSRVTTQVGIVGACPAGLLLAHLLDLNGIESVVVENRNRECVIDRVRVGVLEQGTVDLLRAMRVSGRIERLGLRHDGIRFGQPVRRYSGNE